MNCPYCGKEMERGLIESSEPINFLKKVRFVNQPKKDEGEFMIAKPPFGGRASVDVCLCRVCRAIILKY